MFASGTNSALVLPSAEVSVIESKPSVDPTVVRSGRYPTAAPAGTPALDRAQ